VDAKKGKESMQWGITIKDGGKDEVKSVITFFMETKGWVLSILNLGSIIMMRMYAFIHEMG
jgi:hypothetical protein